MKEGYNPYEGWTRNPEGDQPRLVGAGDKAIPPQMGFTTPDGAEVQISYKRALEYGLVEPQIIHTERIDHYGLRRLDETRE